MTKTKVITIMIKDTNIRFSGVTSKEVYEIISEAARENCLTVSKYISMLLENEASKISGKTIMDSPRSYMTKVSEDDLHSQL